MSIGIDSKFGLGERDEYYDESLGGTDIEKYQILIGVNTDESLRYGSY